MSSCLTSSSPLLCQISWQGQDFFTSQYFHAQYQQQMQIEGKHGKYARHDHFRGKVRGIECYDRLQAEGHVVELAWEDIKQGPPDIFGRFKPLFAKTGYYDLILLDATAQLELTHHLDDELSKEIAYRHSHTTATATQLPRKANVPIAEEIAARQLAAWQDMGRMLGTPAHIVQQEAAKQIEATTGINLRPLLLAAPAQNNIAAEEKMLEPTDLAKALGLPSGYALNRALEEIGWQVKRIGGGWEPTPTGAPYVTQHAWVRGTKSGYNLKWNEQAVIETLHAHNLLTEES